MTFISGRVLGLAFVGGWILFKVRPLHRVRNERREKKIKARVDARVAAIQSHRAQNRVLQTA
jgi:hypothetical protein